MYFELDLFDNIESGRCLPLYIFGSDKTLELVGGFVAKRGDKVGFFAARESWVGLLSDGDHKFYFRPIRNEQGMVVGGLLEEAKTSEESVEITTTGGQDGSI
jgi:hypothetical protein